MAQFENGCITIDFETFPTGQQPTEGLVIDNQFSSVFGLSFSLEDGTNPILAEVGGATTAFGSRDGNDTPIPADAMGRFFLTDDGELVGLISPAIILDFQIPIDSFSGCIVDIDFSEQFIIHARDENEEIILADTISDGDPGTGDGLLTCWGFNLPGCEGKIHSIRFAGFRTQSGAFGLGLDSFSFCYSGLNVDFKLEDVTCSSPGSLEIIPTTTETYTYSMDGINYSSDAIFSDLDTGTYTIYILDNEDCSARVDIVIDPPPEASLEAVPIHTTCALDNGIIMLNLEPELGAIYSIDGIEYQSDSIFTDLSPGMYTMTVRDTNDCFYTQDITLDPSVVPLIDNISNTIDTCNVGAGTISSLATNGIGITGPLEYSIDSTNFIFENTFSNLSEGSYTVTVRDIQGCTAEESIEVSGTPEITTRSIDAVMPECYMENGTLEIDVSGGTGDLIIIVNGQEVYDTILTNLSFGLYSIEIIDELGCTQYDTINILPPICPIYIPNVFTPNGNGAEEIFQAFAHPEYQVGIIDYRIYDRWGELVFFSGQYSIHTDELQYWWDGYFNGKPAMQGVYTYLIEVRHPDDSEELYSGDVTLLR